MAAKDTLNIRIRQIEDLAEKTGDPATIDRLRAALRGRDHHLVAAAARVAGQARLTELAGDMAEAFERFMINPVATDKTCVAKTAIIEALNAMEAVSPSLCRLGVRHVQMEPAWGPPVDAADKLRGQCGLGLAQCGDPDAPYELVTLLMDKEPYPRRVAVAALESIGNLASELLLRLKALQGDEDVGVMGDCFSTLMRLDAGRSISFVAGFLEDENMQVAEEAALALGESHRPDCLEILLAARKNRPDEPWRRMMLLPIALTRLDTAFEELRRVIDEEHERMALAAVEAAGLFRDDPELVTALGKAVTGRKSRPLSEAFRKVFP